MKYEIWQLKKENFKAYGFMDYDWAKAHGFNIDDYEKTYEGLIAGGSLENSQGNVYEKHLDNLFIKFNVHRPEDFRGHSLSTSDIIVLNGKMFYCNSIGWKEIQEEET